MHSYQFTPFLKPPEIAWSCRSSNRAQNAQHRDACRNKISDHHQTTDWLVIFQPLWCYQQGAEITIPIPAGNPSARLLRWRMPRERAEHRLRHQLHTHRHTLTRVDEGTPTRTRAPTYMACWMLDEPRRSTSAVSRCTRFRHPLHGHTRADIQTYKCRHGNHVYNVVQVLL